MISRKITVKGRVQGVWFRAATRDKAYKLGITGDVRNNPDGSVTIHACAPDNAQMEKLLAWCYQGPQLARVEMVLTEEWLPDIIPGEFEIVRGV